MRPGLVVGALTLAGCVANAAPATCPKSEAAVVVALVGLEPGSSSSIEASVALLRSPAAMSALADALGQQVGVGPASVSVAAEADGARARLVVHAPERGLGVVACRAWIRGADEALVRKDAARIWLDSEIAQREQALVTLDRQLALLPSARALPLGSRDAALTAVRVRRMEATQARAALASGAQPVAGSPEVPAALARLLREATRAKLELQGEGRGAGHPDVRAAAARADEATRRLAAQWSEEERAASRLEAAFAALPKQADAHAVGRAFAAYVRTADIEHVSSSLPLSLELLALEHTLVAIDDEALAVRYGSNHPARLVLRARLDALRGEFIAERDTIAGRLDAGLAADGPDPRASAVRDEAAALATTLARLERQRAASRPPRLVAIEPCRAR